MTNKDRTRVVDALKDRFPLPCLLEAVGVSSSSYYYHEQAKMRPDKYAALRRTIAGISARPANTYGYRRVWWELKNRGITVNEKVVRRIMREENILVRYAKKMCSSSYEGEISPASLNLVRRNYCADQPTSCG